MGEIRGNDLEEVPEELDASAATEFEETAASRDCLRDGVDIAKLYEREGERAEGRPQLGLAKVDLSPVGALVERVIRGEKAKDTLLDGPADPTVVTLAALGIEG